MCGDLDGMHGGNTRQQPRKNPLGWKEEGARAVRLGVMGRERGGEKRKREMR